MTAIAQPSSYVYSYTEPHPSVPATRKVAVGRGGAGNNTRLCPKKTTDGATATGPASRSPLPSPALQPKRVGRGGAGNVKAPAKISEVETTTQYETEREARLNQAELIAGEKRIYHIGRGGQGNVLDQNKSRNGSDAGSLSSRRDSVISSISAGSDRGGERKNTSRTGSFVGKVADRLRRTSTNNS